MKIHFLSVKYFLLGKLFSFLETFILENINSSHGQIEDYKQIKSIKFDAKNLASVGIYQKGNKFVLIKSLKYKLKNLKYQHLIHEAAVYKLFADILTTNTEIKIQFPKLYRIIDRYNTLSLIIGYVKGDPLEIKPNSFKLQIIKIVLNNLKSISQKNNQILSQTLPHRNFFHITFFSFFYFLLVTFKDLKNSKQYINLSLIFLQNLHSLNILKNNFIIAHKDLHSKNILVDEKSITILDPEVAVFSYPETDIAHITRYYADELADKEILELLNDSLKNVTEKKRFIALTIYYSFQIMAIAKKHSYEYQEAKNYLLKYFEKILNILMQNEQKLIGEIFYEFLLNILSKIRVLFQIKSIKQPLILCYHSISNDGWRYSTSASDFESQLHYLSKTKKIVSLEKVLKSNIDGQIALTFDDGYKDFLTNALPILKKYNIKGTLFVLGTPDNANRKALDNNKNFLSIADIKIIKNLGWEIGFHTNTHTSLNKLTGKELEKEIIEGKKNLEKQLGFNLRYFAYPMGEYSNEVVQTVKKAGFDAAFSTNGGAVSIKNTSDMHIIDRVCLEGNLALEQFIALLTPLGLLFNKTFINTLKIKVAINKAL